MIKLFTVLIALNFNSCVFSSAVQSDPQGQETRTFNVDSFSHIEGGAAIHYTVQEGSSFAVEATGDKSDLDDLEVKVRGAKLSIGYDSWGTKRYKMEIVITTPSLKGFDFSGASVVEIGAFSGGLSNLDAELSGASKLTMMADCESLKIDVSGASVMHLENSVKTLRVDASGASVVNGFDVNATEVYLDVSGASKINVSASDYLEVDASGASSVTYKGDPRVNQKSSGASRIRKA